MFHHLTAFVNKVLSFVHNWMSEGSEQNTLTNLGIARKLVCDHNGDFNELLQTDYLTQKLVRVYQWAKSLKARGFLQSNQNYCLLV